MKTASNHSNVKVQTVTSEATETIQRLVNISVSLWQTDRMQPLKLSLLTYQAFKILNVVFNTECRICLAGGRIQTGSKLQWNSYRLTEN